VSQIIAGIIDARRGDTFGLTAFTSYGLFWLGLSFSFLLQWMGLVNLDGHGIAWLFVMWGIFTFVFASLTVLFFLLAAHFFGAIPAIIPGIEGIFCGGAAVYGSAAVIVNAKYGREIFPLGSVSK